MDEVIFNACRSINDLLNDKNEKEARNELIRLLDSFEKSQTSYPPIVNHLIREIGLYPYIQENTANWEDKFVYEVFKVDIGSKEKKTLHREQSLLLKKLLEGRNVAASAPTSFGKSFVIDAFIAIKKPKNVVIIVPTIALADETRRRLYKKFSKNYKIITTSDVELGENNIFIFPQERAIAYRDKINVIDILIIDEFYKASVEHDKERASTLLKAIIELKNKALQKYFLAPNISEIRDNPITNDMEKLYFDFNTVFLEIHEIGDVRSDKESELLKILRYNPDSKSLIYAGTFNNISKVSDILKNNIADKENNLLNAFSDWLKQNYSANYVLSDLVKKGIGIHNGKLHRSLSQIQVKLFEDKNCLNNIISTSSIIEGVNTSAENIIIWSNKNGKANLTNFIYKNIAGRGGRMFKHFIGKVYLLDKPLQDTPTQLELEFTEDLINSLNGQVELNEEQEKKREAFYAEMDDLLGQGVYKKVLEENLLQTFRSSKLKEIAQDMKQDIFKWNCLKNLNSPNPGIWENALYKILKQLGWTSYRHSDIVKYIMRMSDNWRCSIPELLGNKITIEEFFEIEREVSFKVSSMLNDVVCLYKLISKQDIDVSPFIAKLSHAFLPKNVYELEEYGLPRMLSKKIQTNGIINLEDSSIPLHAIITEFNSIGVENVKQNLGEKLHLFENYILDYFYDGIRSEN